MGKIWNQPCVHANSVLNIFEQVPIAFYPHPWATHP